ncbi:hypothetical protein [Flavobacterium sp. KACC 22761]|uniref:hypothetical protein n=1 Tax=Flavobacterium sp. KACC 22761 TaxID=3092665 RepID=UPI002A758342|nr:hypothetical protein [Flavobacterium sp. KACC 22761]WPO78258.1 hypothetical protein SCB73_18510 [Flavobacterium sp. KACC 22761]
MKKIASLFLIVTLFYNVLGFYMMFAEQREQVWVTAMEKTEDSDFEVIEIQIDPYAYVVDSGFEEVNEDFTIDSKTYHVFKKRIVNNVLKLYCLKNFHFKVFSKDLKKMVDNQIFDTSSSKENPSKKVIKSFITDYIPNNDTIDMAVCTSRMFFPAKLCPYTPKSELLSGYFTTICPPPDMV